MTLDAARSMLLVIDLQRRLMPAIDEGAAVVTRAALLVRVARRLQVPVLGTEQNPAGLGGSVAPINDLVERMVAKTTFDSCGAPEFLAALDSGRRIVAVGSEAHVCVLQTVLGLRGRGFEVAVVADAVGSRRASDKAAALSRMAAYGVEIVTSEMVIFEWLGRSDRPEFVDLLPLLKQGV